MMRMDDIQRLGQFYDPRFPVYWNDVDLAMRARDNGIRFARIATCRIYHLGGHSIETLNAERWSMLFYSKAGMMGFAEKWNFHPSILKLVFFTDAVFMVVIKGLRRLTGFKRRKTVGPASQGGGEKRSHAKAATLLFRASLR